MNRGGYDGRFWDDAFQDVLGDGAFRESISSAAARGARQRMRRRRSTFAAVAGVGIGLVAGIFFSRETAPPLPADERLNAPVTIVHTTAGSVSHVSTRAGGVELVATADAPPRYETLSDPELLELFADFSPRIERDAHGAKRLVLIR